MDYLGKKQMGSEGNGASTGSARTYDPSFSLGDSTSGKVNYALGRASRDLDLNAGGSDFNCVGNCGLAVYDGDGNVNVDYKLADIRAYIDLNVEVNDCGVFREEGNVNESKGHSFDLNLELGEIFDLNISVHEDDIKDVRDEGSLNERKGQCFDLNLESLEDINGEDMDNCKVVERDPLKDSFPNHDGFSSGLGPCCDVLGCAPIAISVAQSMSTASYPVAVELKTPSYNEGCAKMKSLTGRRGRKRTLSSDTGTKAALENDLRSTCRGRKSALLSDVDSNLSSSPNAGVVTGVSEVMGQEGPGEQNVLTLRVQLPHSSGNLSLGDMPVLDVFSVYSFLRSFSRSLFLSPFELGDFVCSLNCNTPSLLFDSISVSLLKTFRKHLESIQSDGRSQSASHCLRFHNWDFLDLITWPIFMVDYLLVFNSGLKAGFDLCSLKLFENAYHKQSPSVKIEMLRCLCDDVIDKDCIKSEINKRSRVTVPGADIVCCSKRRVGLMDIAGCSVTQENNKETVNSNSNKCCLCRLDGKLICCDGCTAAFHLRCVGIISNHLPLGGKWYCPECGIDKDKPHMKVGNIIRGANMLGTDAHGRTYFSCCGYLLVQEDCQSVSSSKYYHQDDIPAVVEMLKSSLPVFSTVTSAVVKQWDFLFEIDGVKKYSGSQEGLTMQFSEHSVSHPKVGDVVAEDASSVLATIGGEVPKSVFLKAYTVDHAMNRGNQILSTTSSADASQTVTHSKETAEVNLQCTRSRVSDGVETQRKVTVMSIPSEEKSNDPGKPDHDLSRINSKNYVNYYSLAQTDAANSDQLSRTKGLYDDVNVISMEFCWPNVLNAPVHALMENCGWCLPCRVPNNERECLVSMRSGILSLENSSSKALLVRLDKSRKSRLVDVMFHMCFIGERLQGVVLGPWLNPQYSESWRQSLLRANDIASVIVCLLKLVSNLHPLALSADWTKHVDYADAVGSDIHAVSTSMRGPSRNSLLKQRARYPALEANMTSDTTIGLDLLWWRGGRLSGQPLNSKVLPRALASKAAQRGGCRKIPGIFYPDRSEFALKSRFVEWQVGVESSESVEQLALHVREFDANIKWVRLRTVANNSNYSMELQLARSAWKEVLLSIFWNL